MSAIDDLLATVAKLRAPDGCPWDREQTHQSLCDCLVNECSELLDTIDRLDYPHMREELGDVLLQVVMHALISAEAGRFTFDEVAAEINAKLIRRHPHVFGEGARADNSTDVLKLWDAIKAAEKPNAPDTPFKDLPPQQPALLYAHDIFKQMVKKQLPADGLVDVAAIQASASDLSEADAGKQLFALAAACRSAGIDPESALRREASRLRDTITERVTEAKAAEA